MSKRNLIAGFLAVMSLFAMGCATMATGSAGPSDMAKCDPPGHRPPSVIAVLVYQDAGGNVVVLPEEIVVEHPNQTIVWTAMKGEIADIVFERNECSAGPPPIPGRGRQRDTRIPPGHIGLHKYGFTFHPDGGSPIKVDPLIIVEY